MNKNTHLESLVKESKDLVQQVNYHVGFYNEFMDGSTEPEAHPANKILGKLNDDIFALSIKLLEMCHFYQIYKIDKSSEDSNPVSNIRLDKRF